MLRRKYKITIIVITENQTHCSVIFFYDTRLPQITYLLLVMNNHLPFTKRAYIVLTLKANRVQLLLQYILLYPATSKTKILNTPSMSYGVNNSIVTRRNE